MMVMVGGVIGLMIVHIVVRIVSARVAIVLIRIVIVCNGRVGGIWLV